MTPIPPETNRSEVRAAFSCLIDTFSIDTTRLLIDTKSIEIDARSKRYLAGSSIDTSKRGRLP